MAVSRKVAADAAALRIANPALAAQLSLAAYRLHPTTEARSSMLSTFANPYAVGVEGGFQRSPVLGVLIGGAAHAVVVFAPMSFAAGFGGVEGSVGVPHQGVEMGGPPRSRDC